MSQKNQKLAELVEYAFDSGASAAVVISTGKIVVDPSLADKCRDPRCSSYGLSKSCPPHVAGPKVLNNRLKEFNLAIFFKIDVPAEMLYSSENREIFQLLHQVAAGIEMSAVGMGFRNVQAYAGGSCKNIFCHDHAECRALSEEGTCRHPQYARPSMSGFGINVAELFKTAGWPLDAGGHDDDSRGAKMASICGLVLIC